MGTKTEDVERYLGNVLYLGKQWNSGIINSPKFIAILSLTTTIVLLLDEADVFLEERSLSDLHRNSLVAGMIICSGVAIILEILTLKCLSLPACS